MGKLIDITGKKYGRMTVISKDESKNGRTMWLCRCDCGNVKVVGGKDLKNGKIKSCGCLSKEVVIENNTTHNLSSTRLYNIWNGMVGRCFRENDINYKHYGGRGITICKQWLDFVNFYDWSLQNGYDKDLTIDRIDVDDDYKPSNCRWVDMLIQQNNKRNCHYITIDGETHSIRDWERKCGFKRGVITSRINRGLKGSDLIAPLRNER